jgi:hypothetical protein
MGIAGLPPTPAASGRRLFKIIAFSLVGLIALYWFRPAGQRVVSSGQARSVLRQLH